MKKALFMAAAAMVIAVPVVAQGMGDHGKPSGPVTRAELQKKLGDRFAQLDTNKDGAVTKAEFDAHRETMRKEWAEKRTERHNERFAEMDKNKDGQVSKAEFDAFNTAREAKRTEWMKSRSAEAGKPGDHHGPGKKGMRGHGWHGKGGEEMFTRLDANKDGKVTLAEFSAKPLEMFDKADANKDGTVTPEERRAAFDKMRAEWRAKGAQKPAA